jgi:soluble lytic murein transglycosylase
LNARDYTTAASSLAVVSSADPERHAEALYRLAVAHRRAGRAAEFESTGARLRSLYPKSEWAGEFLADLVDHLESKNRTAEMQAARQALIKGYPRSEEAAEVSYDMAWTAYKAREYARAAELFTEHLATFRSPYTKWVGEAAFWAGRAHEYLGNKRRALFFYDLAVRRYPYGYHGHVAGRRARDLQRSTPALKAEEPAPGSALAAARENALAVIPIKETAGEDARPRVSRAEDFLAIALWDLAVNELTAAQELHPTSPIVHLRLAQAYKGRGDFYQATLVLRKGYPDIYSYKNEEVPREGWEVMFPLTNWETIKQRAAAENLDPFIVAGLIRQESVFNPRAVSRANARGLMQLLPSTGRMVARTQGLGAVSVADLFNPTTNITLGTAYFAQQLRNFGRVEYAAAAYNAGPGRVVQWKAARADQPIEEWVENIPLSETRGYVMGVLRYAANYRRFYGRGQEREGGEW